MFLLLLHVADLCNLQGGVQKGDRSDVDDLPSVWLMKLPAKLPCLAFDSVCGFCFLFCFCGASWLLLWELATIHKFDISLIKITVCSCFQEMHSVGDHFNFHWAVTLPETSCHLEEIRTRRTGTFHRALVFTAISQAVLLKCCSSYFVGFGSRRSELTSLLGFEGTTLSKLLSLSQWFPNWAAAL